MKTMTLEEFHNAIKEQEVVQNRISFICPQCGTIQCAKDLIDAGAGSTFDDVEKYLGFSCVGRFTENKGCNWTLGGLFQLHKLEVITPDGQKHPRFEPATREQISEMIWGK